MRWRLGTEQQYLCLASRNGSQTCTLQAGNGRSGGVFQRRVGQLKENTLSVIFTEDLLGPCLMTMHWSPKETATSLQRSFPSAYSSHGNEQHSVIRHLKENEQRGVTRHLKETKVRKQGKKNFQESETLWNMYETSRKWCDSLGCRKKLGHPRNKNSVP